MAQKFQLVLDISARVMSARRTAYQGDSAAMTATMKPFATTSDFFVFDKGDSHLEQIQMIMGNHLLIRALVELQPNLAYGKENMFNAVDKLWDECSETWTNLLSGELKNKK